MSAASMSMINVIDSLQRGELHIIEDGLQPLMLEAINTGFLSFSKKVSAS